MQKFTQYLSRLNTWAAISILAMLGWLFDTLFWYLETHPLTLAGVFTYASHSWYALPLLGAILIILRLRHPSALLSLTIYDEHGLPIHQQGDFPHETEIIGPIFAALRGTSQGTNLHCLELPTGSIIYFFRQSGLIMVAAFSGTIDETQLEKHLPILQNTNILRESLLNDLPIDVAALTANLLNAPVERDVLTHLWDVPNMALTRTDLAARIRHNGNDIAVALKNLQELNLVQRQDACSLTFYRLTEDETWLARLRQFMIWRNKWLRRARQVEEYVGLVE